MGQLLCAYLWAGFRLPGIAEVYPARRDQDRLLPAPVLQRDLLARLGRLIVGVSVSRLAVVALVGSAVCFPACCVNMAGHQDQSQA